MPLLLYSIHLEIYNNRFDKHHWAVLIQSAIHVEQLDTTMKLLITLKSINLGQIYGRPKGPKAK